MLEVLRKLKGRSLDELRVRGVQALSAQTERYGLASDSRLPSDATLLRSLDPAKFQTAPQSSSDLLDHFRKRTSPGFFAAFEETSATREELRSRFAMEGELLIERADRVVEGRFDLLGLKNLYFGEPIDWHFEPVSGKTSPLLHWSRIDEIDSIVTGDKKIVWELNRHQYFATLGRAYWVTQDERYAQTFVNHVGQWMDTNPPKLGLNWISSLELAYRAISWLWALNFFKDSSHLVPEVYARALKFLYLHARHLEMYLSTYSSPNTHLTGEALGLFYIGTMLPEFREAARWLERGRRILIDELERHVLSDGVYFERASYYHRYTTDFYTHFLILSERNGHAVDQAVKAKLQSLLDHLMYITRPDGTTPLVGDDDGGQLAILDGRRPNDFRAALSTGAALFDRGDYKHVAGEASEATLWLLGSEGLRKFERLASHVPESASRAFHDGGCYVMRDDWTSDANYLLLDCGPHGVYNCGHAHADALSFELAARGRMMLVDSGTYTYTGSKELRDYFRSSAAHNTLTIDGESSSVSAGPFSWKQTANASIIKWKSDQRFDFFSGAHDGYLRLSPAPAMHTRSVLFLRNDYWVMRDSVETAGPHQYDLHFHFAADARPFLENHEESGLAPTERAMDHAGLQIFSFTHNGAWHIEDGWVSSCYGERTQTSVCTLSASGIGAHESFTFLVPRRPGDARVEVQEIEATGGLAFEIRDASITDMLFVAKGEMVESDRLRTDFKWTWARFGGDKKTLDELVLVDGRSLWLDGRQVLNLPEPVDYAVAKRAGDILHVETTNGIVEIPLTLDDFVTASSFANPNSKI